MKLNYVGRALEAVNRTTDRLSLRAAARRFGIPLNTLGRRNKNKNLGFHGSGSTTVLSEPTYLLLIVRMINLMFIQFWKKI